MRAAWAKVEITLIATPNASPASFVVPPITLPRPKRPYVQKPYTSVGEQVCSSIGLRAAAHGLAVDPDVNVCRFDLIGHREHGAYMSTNLDGGYLEDQQAHAPARAGSSFFMPAETR